MIDFKLKKIKYFDAMSEETPCFTAEIWENDKLVAYVKNAGHGGGNQVDYLVKDSTYRFDPLDVEAEIFGRVWLNDDVKKHQSKGIVLFKDDVMELVKFPIAISKWKRHPQYASWNQKAIDKYTAQGYQIMNTNL